MGSIRRRLERLEAGTVEETPWWTLPPGEEPTWPRPFKDVALSVLEAVSRRDIERYLNTGHTPSAVEAYVSNEAFHEVRWRKYGIARLAAGGQTPQPADWSEVEQVLEDVRDYLAERGPHFLEEEQDTGSPLERYLRVVEEYSDEKGVRDV